jgi:hypothetical protein
MLRISKLVVAFALTAASLLPAVASSEDKPDREPVRVASRTPADNRYDDALELFKAGRYPEAYGVFATLARNDDPDAARIASFMHQYGPALFGSHWDAFPHQVRHWDSLATNKPLRKTTEFKPTNGSAKKVAACVEMGAGKAD